MSDNDLDELKKMIADYMESGYLENIIAMFRQDKSLYSIIGDILGDERLRVRIGAIALVESLIDEDYAHLYAAIPGIAEQLNNPSPNIRGDAAHMLGIIGHKDALPYLLEAQNEDNAHVKEAVDESIEAIRQNALSDRVINGD